MSSLTISFFLFAIFFVWIWLFSIRDSVKFTTRCINHFNSFSGSIVNLIIKSRFHNFIILLFWFILLLFEYCFSFYNLSELYWYTSFWLLLLQFKYCMRGRFSFYNLCVTVVKGLYLHTLFWLLSLTFKYYIFLLQFICNCWVGLCPLIN